MSLTGDDYDPRQSIQELSANLNQPDKFAAIFCSAAQSQKTIDETLKRVIRDLLKNDNEAINTLKHLVKECDKEDWMFLRKKVVVIIGSLLLIIFGVLVERFLLK